MGRLGGACILLAVLHAVLRAPPAAATRPPPPYVTGLFSPPPPRTLIGPTLQPPTSTPDPCEAPTMLARCHWSTLIRIWTFGLFADACWAETAAWVEGSLPANSTYESILPFRGVFDHVILYLLCEKHHVGQCVQNMA